MQADMHQRFGVISEPAYRRFITGYGLSYVLYWVTLLSVGWWMWETTRSATWVSAAYACDLLPSVVVTPFAAAFADRGDRFRILKTVLWLQVSTGLTLAAVAALGWLTPALLAAFVFVEGTLVGFSQPAFFGLLNRLVSPANLSAAVGVNVSVVQTSYILGPVLAGFLFSFGLGVAPLAFAANALGTLGYIWCLSGITLRPQPAVGSSPAPALLRDVRAGLAVFWANPTVFRAAALVALAAMLQRPLTSLMSAINDHFALLPPAYFTLLTASFMCGGLLAGLAHARRNSDLGQETVTLRAMLGLVLFYAAIFPLLAVAPARALLALICFFLMGFAGSFVTAGNSIILQTRTPEQMRSRVLGNNLMMSRGAGAVALLCVGPVVDAQGFGVAMTGLAMAVAVLLALVLWRAGRRRPEPSYTST